jgi:hypothetical protein
MLKMGTAELKIGRCLAYLGAVHHDAKVFRSNVRSVGLETMVHGG